MKEYPNLLERKKQKQRTGGGSGGDARHGAIDTSNPDEMRRFFLEQVQQGEDCLSRGDLDNGVVCSQPQSLMSLFQQTLPPELFQEIIMRLPRIVFRQYRVHLHPCPVVVVLL